jgi:predicted ABC-type ATPase
MRRGMGAYSTSYRPTITGGAPNSRQAWGFARVNKFLLKKGGTKVKAAYVQDDDLMAKGGKIGQEITCINCGWNWNTKDSDEFDKYVCHNCGFDNRTFYDSDPIGYKDGGLLHALDVAMTNLKKNGIVLTDNDGEITLIAYNTGNQSIKPSLYNKSLIYKSVQPIKSANEIIQNFDSNNFDRFDADKIDLLKKKHLIIINQNEVIYDNKNSSSILKEGGIMKNQIALPDTSSNYADLQPILAKQGYELKKILKPTKSVSEIADEFDVTESYIEKQLSIGTEHEMEHFNSEELAKQTALHHLAENPDYYIMLKDMEMRAEAEKLEGYYKDGGSLNKETTCEVLDENGERQIDAESIANLTECINNLPQTKSFHYDYEKNDYKPYRKRLQKDIIYEFKKDLICVERDEPIAILMGGSPASGKSTFLKKYAPYLLKEEIFKIDADEIRSRLPEYKGYNASQTHLETKDIVNTLLSDRNIGIPCKFDLIYDGTMNNTKSYLPLIRLLKKDGYKVFIVYIDRVPKDVIVKRALERYKKSGRFVPLEVIDDFFEKGKTAFEELKKESDGFMLVDGSNQDYKIVERGGEDLPQDRNYSKIGEPIKITSEDVVRELKRGGELNPDDPKVKSAMTHKSGEAGGLLVGNRHSEGGIKAVNKSTGQALEMEGGEVVITRDAVSDESKREFEGQMLTNRQILSKINESGGGVSFADGGDIPDRCACSGKSYNYGGKLMKDNEIVNTINTSFRKMFGIKYPDLLPSEAMNKIFANKFKYEKGGTIFQDSGSLTIVDKKIPSFLGFSNMFKHTSLVPEQRQYKDFLKENFNIIFEELPYKIQSGLMLGNQKLIDNYINN